MVKAQWPHCELVVLGRLWPVRAEFQTGSTNTSVSWSKSAVEVSTGDETTRSMITSEYTRELVLLNRKTVLKVMVVLASVCSVLVGYKMRNGVTA